ncbi:hypothetical protein F5B19DRAFT_316016 [Rostrohypoxylon terebratum]|nr:hypothetical protein F5B19DRAFT_316016 [Rostrohypoxylon terebratum]
MFNLRNPVGPARRSASDRRSKELDIHFKLPLFRHETGTRYTWSTDQTEIFKRHVQENPDDASSNIEHLLAKLGLDGYDDVVTFRGVNYKWGILIPKVKEKLNKVANQMYKQDDDEERLSRTGQALAGLYRDESESVCESVCESPEDSLVPGHDGKGKTPSNEYRINSLAEYSRRVNKEASKLCNAGEALRMIHSDLPDDDPLSVSLFHHKNLARVIQDQIEDKNRKMARTWWENHGNPKAVMEFLGSDDGSEDPK